jgi:hypothetical protein
MYLVDFGFDDDGFGGAVGISTQIEHLGLEQDGIGEFVQILARGRGQLHALNISAKLLQYHAVLQQLSLDLQPRNDRTRHTTHDTTTRRHDDTVACGTEANGQKRKKSRRRRRRRRMGELGKRNALCSGWLPPFRSC